MPTPAGFATRHRKPDESREGTSVYLLAVVWRGWPSGTSVSNPTSSSAATAPDAHPGPYQRQSRPQPPSTSP